MIVDECRIYVGLNRIALAVEPVTPIADLQRPTFVIRSVVRNRVGFGFPHPRPGKLEIRNVEGIAYCLHFPKGIEAVGLSDLFGNGRALLRLGSRRDNERCTHGQEPNYGEWSRDFHTYPVSVN